MFVEPYLKVLRRRRYTPPAFAEYVGRCIGLARRRAEANPDAVRSVLVNALGFHALFLAGALGLAFRVEGGVAIRFILHQSVWVLAGTVWLLAHLGLLRDADGQPRSRIGLPNQLSVFRLLLIPAIHLFIVEGYLVLATLAYAVAGLSDVLDGFIARRWSMGTRLGLILDPLVDVGYIVAIYSGFYASGWIPGWLMGLVAARYVLLFGGVTILYLRNGRVAIQPTAYGRSSGLVMTGINLVLLALVGGGLIDENDDVLHVLFLGLGALFVAGILQLIVMGLHNLRVGGGDTAPGTPDLPAGGRE